MTERQELHCHACNRYVQFDIDLELDGNHVLNCPNCGHEHCRVVRNGRITGDRWDSRNDLDQTAITISSASITSSATSNYMAYYDVTTADGNSASGFLYDSWTAGTTA